MTKKHFIALADAIRAHNEMAYPPYFGRTHLETLAAFCKAQNPRFNWARWIDYIEGRCEANGGDSIPASFEVNPPGKVDRGSPH